MFAASARQRSLYVYHLHMGGPDADALEWQALLSSRYAPRLDQLGVTSVQRAEEADIVVVTGLLTRGNLDAVLEELSYVPNPSVLVALGDAAANGGMWARSDLPGLEGHTLAHYAEVQLTVPGNPPTPQAIIAAVSAAAQALTRPPEKTPPWQEE